MTNLPPDTTARDLVAEWDSIPDGTPLDPWFLWQRVRFVLGREAEREAGREAGPRPDVPSYGVADGMQTGLVGEQTVTPWPECVHEWRPLRSWPPSYRCSECRAVWKEGGLVAPRTEVPR